MFARLFILGELALCKSPSEERLCFDVAELCQNSPNVTLCQRVTEITLCQRVTEKSYKVGLLWVSNRLVGSPYRLVAIQRRRPHFYEVKYSALYFTWK